jgi:hypothetical protein
VEEKAHKNEAVSNDFTIRQAFLAPFLFLSVHWLLKVVHSRMDEAPKDILDPTFRVRARYIAGILILPILRDRDFAGTNELLGEGFHLLEGNLCIPEPIGYSMPTLKEEAISTTHRVKGRLRSLVGVNAKIMTRSDALCTIL